MRRPPRSRHESLYSRAALRQNLVDGLSVLVCVLLVYLVTRSFGYDDDQVRALTFITLVLGNLALIFSNRSHRGVLRRPYGRAIRHCGGWSEEHSLAWSVCSPFRSKICIQVLAAWLGRSRAVRCNRRRAAPLAGTEQTMDSPEPVPRREGCVRSKWLSAICSEAICSTSQPCRGRRVLTSGAVAAHVPSHVRAVSALSAMIYRRGHYRSAVSTEDPRAQDRWLRQSFPFLHFRSTRLRSICMPSSGGHRAVHSEPPWHVLEVEQVAQRPSRRLGAGSVCAGSAGALDAPWPQRIARAASALPADHAAGQFADFMILVLIAAAVMAGIVGESRTASRSW